MKEIMYIDGGIRISKCMGIMCPSDKRRKCKWYQAWRENGGCLFAHYGVGECEYFEEGKSEE